MFKRSMSCAIFSNN